MFEVSDTYTHTMLYIFLADSNTAATPHNAGNQRHAANEQCYKVTFSDNHTNIFAISMHSTNKNLLKKIRDYT